MDELKIYAERWDELKPLLSGRIDGCCLLHVNAFMVSDLVFAAELVRRERETRHIMLHIASVSTFHISRPNTQDRSREVLDIHGHWRDAFKGLADYPYHEANVIGLIEGAK